MKNKGRECWGPCGYKTGRCPGFCTKSGGLDRGSWHVRCDGVHAVLKAVHRLLQEMRASRIAVHLDWMPRHENSKADFIANRARLTERSFRIHPPAHSVQEPQTFVQCSFDGSASEDGAGTATVLAFQCHASIESLGAIGLYMKEATNNETEIVGLLISLCVSATVILDRNMPEIEHFNA